MKLAMVFIGFAFVGHIHGQLDIDVEDILYGEDEEEELASTSTTTESEYDEEELASTSTTKAPESTTESATTTTTTQAPPTTINNSTVASPLATNLTTNTTASNQNQTFSLVAMPANGSLFGAVLSPSTTVTTERVHYVLGQVGNILNNVGKLNITGIVDHALGIRNNYIARPLVTGILNIVFCNPVAFNDNNCRKRGKDGTDKNNSTQT